METTLSQNKVKKRELIRFCGTCIPRERVLSFWRESHKVFPYITIRNPFATTKQFPFFRKWTTTFRFKVQSCISLELDNGKIMRQFFKDGYYSSATNCEQAMSEFIRNYFD